jgi:hypothetical protein
LQAAFIERDTDPESNWRDGVRRAAELLEWLSHPEINTEDLPFRLLAAAAYQLAGYPARASGLLNATPPEDTESRILLALLKADFPLLLRELTNYWSGNLSPTLQTIKASFWSEIESPFASFHQIIVMEVAKALGVLCAEMRWGEEDRLAKAIGKLSNISNMMLHGSDFYAWMLANLCAEAASTYTKSSMRAHLIDYSTDMNPRGKKAVENYIRLSHQARKSLFWPSQVSGIKRLVTKEPFTLCTPTGSGKTTVAELAILQNLFSERSIAIDESLNLSPCFCALH